MSLRDRHSRSSVYDLTPKEIQTAGLQRFRKRIDYGRNHFGGANVLL